MGAISEQIEKEGISKFESIYLFSIPYWWFINMYTLMSVEIHEFLILYIIDEPKQPPRGVPR